MFRIHHIVLLSCFVFQNSLTIDSTDHHKSTNPINITPLFPPDIPEEVRQAIINEIAKQQAAAKVAGEQNKKTNEFSDEDAEEMALALATSPKRAQCILEHLQDPTYLPNGGAYRAAFFIGEPGTGKTITAQAIGSKMAQEGWDYKFISSTSFLGEYRNQTAIRLEQELKKIAESNKPTIIIIDELHRLLENSNSKHHDTDSTSTVLWTFLDKQKNNTHFFLIGTMNRITKLPKPVKDRMFFNYITFPLITDPQAKNTYLRKNLTTLKALLDKEITDEFLTKELDKINACSNRNLKNLSVEIVTTHIINNNKKDVPIKKESITQAINEYLHRTIEMEYDVIDETDEERQDRYHQENIAMNERHFIQQQKIQIAINDHQNDIHSSGIVKNHLTCSTRQKIDELISDEQNQIYQDMMANTQARKDREAAEKAAAEAELAAIEANKWFWLRGK